MRNVLIGNGYIFKERIPALLLQFYRLTNDVAHIRRVSVKLKRGGIDCSQYPVTKARMTEYVCYLCEKKNEVNK